MDSVDLTIAAVNWAKPQFRQDLEATKYLKIVVRHLQKLSRLRKSQVSLDQLTKKSRNLMLKPPTGILPEEQVPYARFVHQLFNTGFCHGMVREDPFGAGLLVNNTVRLYKRLFDDPANSYLISEGTGLLLLSGMSYRFMNVHEAAISQFKHVLELSKLARHGTDVLPTERAVQSMQVQGALAALYCHEIIEDHAEADINPVDYLSFSKDMFGRLIKADALTLDYNPTDWILARMGMASVWLEAKDRFKSVAALTQAVEVLEQRALPEKDATHLYAYSLVFQRAAETEAAEERMPRAVQYISKALVCAERSSKLFPYNTHYRDHYAEMLNEAAVMIGMDHNFAQAQDLFLQAIDQKRILAERDEKYKVGLTASLNNVVTLMRRFGRMDVAKIYVDDVLQMFKELGSSPRAAELAGSYDVGRLADAIQDNLSALAEHEERKQGTLYWKRQDSHNFGPN